METPDKRERSHRRATPCLPASIKVIEWGASLAVALSERQRAQVTDAVTEQVKANFTSKEVVTSPCTVQVFGRQTPPYYLAFEVVGGGPEVPYTVNILALKLTRCSSMLPELEGGSQEEFCSQFY